MATTDKRLKSYESALEEALSRVAGSRVGQTVLGGAKNSLASDVNSGATIYDLTQGARDAMMGMYVSDSANSLRQAKQALAQLEREGASAYEIENQQTVVNSLQRQYDAMSMSGAVQRGATQAAYQLADDIRDSAAASIAKAKDGLNAIGKAAVDVGAALTEMGLDKGKSTLLIGGLGPNYEEDNILKKLADYLEVLPLTSRNYGKNSQLARQDGADLKGATIYGTTTALTDTAIEKAFDGLSGHYGKSFTDKLAKEFSDLFKNNKDVQKLASAGFNDLGEGTVESVATDIADYLLKSVYNGRSAKDNLAETEWGRVGRNALINTIIGILLGDKAFE